MVTRPLPEDLVDNVLRFQKAAFAGTGLDSTLAPGASEEEGWLRISVTSWKQTHHG